MGTVGVVVIVPPLVISAAIVVIPETMLLAAFSIFRGISISSSNDNVWYKLSFPRDVQMSTRTPKRMPRKNRKTSLHFFGSLGEPLGLGAAIRTGIVYCRVKRSKWCQSILCDVLLLDELLVLFGSHFDGKENGERIADPGE